jgi:hypothetical protein
MSRVKLTVSELNADETFAAMEKHSVKITGNPDYTTPSPTALVFDAAMTTLEGKIAAYNAAADALQIALSERDAVMNAAKPLLSQRVDYVNLTSGGIEAKILGAGFDVRQPPVPVGPLPAPANVSVSQGDNDGSVHVNWDRVHGAQFYEIEHTTDPNTPSTWQNHTATGHSGVLMNGLTSGARLWFRVRAVGAAGPGAWSDPAVKTVP